MTTPRWVQGRCDRDFIDRIAIMTLRSHIRFFAITIIALMIAITSPRSLYRRRDRDHHAAISTMPQRSRFHRQDRNPAPEIAEAIFQIAPPSRSSRSSRWDRYNFAAIAIIASAICCNCIEIAVIVPRFAITASLSLIIFYEGTSIALEKCKKDCNIF